MHPPGTLVKVNDTKMHVYSRPVGAARHNSTVVFLAGSGTECPTFDFKPLWHLLQGSYSFAVVERPGYGWSEETKLPRDIDTLLEETREAIRQSGISGPFIPAAHSMAGLEAIYWSQKYPDEVSAIIGLDMAVPPVYENMKYPKYLGVLARLAHVLRTPVAKSMVKNHPAVKASLLNPREQDQMRSVVSKQILSKNMLDETFCVKENAQKVAAGKTPAMPVLCFLSKQSIEKMPPWGTAHREYFSNNSQAHFMEMAQGHYMHREDPKTIADTIELLL